MEINALNDIGKVYSNNDYPQTGTFPVTIPSVSFGQEPDVFISSFGPQNKPSGFGIFGKIANKVKEVATQVNETINSPETKQKINAAKLAKLFVDNGTIDFYSDAFKYKEIINELAKHDYEQVVKKYNALLKNMQTEGVKKGSTEYLQFMGLGQVYDVLKYDKLQAEDIDEIFRISRNRPKREYSDDRIKLSAFVDVLKSYENFDNLSASMQKYLMQSVEFSFPTPQSLTVEEAKNLSKHSPLTKFEYINDLRNVDTEDELVKNLDERRRNIPCHAIPVDNEKIEKVLSQKGIENLTDALNKTDLSKYEKGFLLEYSRKEFINDFNKLTEKLSNEDKKKVYEYFGFKINSANDIINFPNPDTQGEIDDNLKSVIAQGQEYINKFMLENRVKLNSSDKALETELNNIIQVFPEFISIIGKLQHRGDSIDYHTMDDLKRILNDERFKKLPQSEQKILTTATLFHDFGKVQGEIDDGHARKSAILTKEILKKTPLSFDEKERVFNLINHSHWLVDGSLTEDIAFDFRRPNDFTMAEIFEKADSNSAGFEYNPNPEKIAQIKQNIDKINSTGIPLFVNQLPKEDKYYDKTPSGTRYLDLRDPEMSVEKYGYPKGTMVKDLNFLCHSSSDDPKDFETLCDDSKEVCLSTSLLDCRQRFSTGYNSSGSYIVSGNNASIVLGGKDTGCTGGHRGRVYAKNAMYLQKPEKGFLSNINDRQEIPNKIKEALNLSDEEYSQMFTQICNLETLDEISDIKLQNGRKIKKEDIPEITPEVLERFIAQLHQEYKPKTAKRKIASIKAFFKNIIK